MHLELSERNNSRPRIVAARMRDVDYVGVVTIASGPRLLARGKMMAEDSLIAWF